MIPVLFEDNHLLVVNKPADWVVQGAGAGQRSLYEWAGNYLREKYQKPGNVFVGIVSRLDSPVTGVLPIARTSKAASRLSEQFRESQPEKIYWAIAGKRPPEPNGTLEHHLVRREQDAVTKVATGSHPLAKLAVLEYRCVGESDLGYQLEIRLITGRKHQIRAQLAAIGCAIVGDSKYGASQRFSKGIALHCRRLSLLHPTLKTQMDWVASLPDYWRWNQEG